MTQVVSKVTKDFFQRSYYEGPTVERCDFETPYLSRATQHGIACNLVRWVLHTHHAAAISAAVTQADAAVILNTASSMNFKLSIGMPALS